MIYDLHSEMIKCHLNSRVRLKFSKLHQFWHMNGLHSLDHSVSRLQVMERKKGEYEQQTAAGFVREIAAEPYHFSCIHFSTCFLNYKSLSQPNFRSSQQSDKTKSFIADHNFSLMSTHSQSRCNFG